MSSIDNWMLQQILKEYPDDYEVIFELHEKKNGETKKSYAYINGVDVNHNFKEVKLMN